MKDSDSRLAPRIRFLQFIQEQGKIWEPDYSNLDTSNGSMYQWGLDAGFIHNYNEENEDGTRGERYGELTDLGHELVALYEIAKADVAKPSKPANPILRNGLFATPESFVSLRDYCLRHNGSERAAAITCSEMAINLCHKLVKEEIQRTS